MLTESRAGLTLPLQPKGWALALTAMACLLPRGFQNRVPGARVLTRGFCFVDVNRQKQCQRSEPSLVLRLALKMRKRERTFLGKDRVHGQGHRIPHLQRQEEPSQYSLCDAPVDWPSGQRGQPCLADPAARLGVSTLMGGVDPEAFSSERKSGCDRNVGRSCV